MKALILDNRVVEIATEEFEVHASMAWMECSNECTTEWTLESGVLTAPAPYVDERTYVELRQAAYPKIGDQLDALFHAGVFPAEMAAEIQAVKDANPKPV
jgi:hypothetical protein